MTLENQRIIELARVNVYDHCAGPLTAIRVELEDYGFSWDEKCERYALAVLEQIGA